MKKLKVLCLVLICLLALNLVACGNKKNTDSNTDNKESGQSNEQEYTLQLAYAAAEDKINSPIMKQFKENVEKKSNGKIKIDIYPNSQLGGDRELIESCQAGNIAIVIQGTSPQVNFIPKLAIFDLLNLFEDIDVAYKVLTGPFREKIAAEYEKAGFKLLCMVPVGMREMTSKKPITKIEDFKGVKIRTMENPYHIAYWKALGANPTPLAFSELYMALQQGTVDAQENPYAAVIASKFYEVQKYVINTNHIMLNYAMIMNKSLYDNMPDEYKKIINESAKEAEAALFKANKEGTANMAEELKSKGMQFIDLSPEVLQQMRDAAKPVYDMIRKDIGNELVDELLKTIEEAKK